MDFLCAARIAGRAPPQSSELLPSLGRLLLCVAALLAGCATMPKCPGQGGPAWHELTTRHFRLQTDLELDDAKRAVSQLELMRAAILAAWSPQIDPLDRSTVVIFRYPRALEFYGLSHLGGRETSNPYAPLVVSMPTSDEIEMLKVSEWTHMAHELAHRLTLVTAPVQPRWVAEGIASYFETIEVSPDGRTAKLGGDNPVLERQLFFSNGALRLGDLWHWTAPPPRPGIAGTTFELYASAWAWVHLLRTNHPVEFDDFLKRMAAGEDEPAAWNEAFPPAQFSNLPLELGPHVLGKLPSLNVEIPKLDPNPSVRRMTDADFHAMRAGLWATLFRDTWDARATAKLASDIRDALADDPMNLAARILALNYSHKRSLTLAKRLVSDAPSSINAWLIEYAGLRATHASEADLNRALDGAEAAAADDPNLENTLAWNEALSGRWDKAQAHASHLLEIAPWSPYFLDTVAMIAGHFGRCDQALRLEQRAIGHERGFDLERLLFMNRVERIRQTCVPGQLDPQLNFEDGAASLTHRLSSLSYSCPHSVQSPTRRIAFDTGPDGSGHVAFAITNLIPPDDQFAACLSTGMRKQVMPGSQAFTIHFDSDAVLP
jgi:tetratricopeptide (TPR) repeat protein